MTNDQWEYLYREEMKCFCRKMQSMQGIKKPKKVKGRQKGRGDEKVSINTADVQWSTFSRKYHPESVEFHSLCRLLSQHRVTTEIHSGDCWNPVPRHRLDCSLYSHRRSWRVHRHRHRRWRWRRLQVQCWNGSFSC